jgi:lipoprotein-releasing system permease protein
VYQALLTRRYLFSKIMPLIAAVAVALCTAMVLIVWSVMGGFLNQLLASGKSMIGDASIQWPVSGIAHYEDLIARLEKDPAVAAATPTVETLGLLGLRSGEPRKVEVLGIEPAGYDAVTGYYSRLYWKRIEKPDARDVNREDPRLTLAEGFERAGQLMLEPDRDTEGSTPEKPAIVTGVDVTGYNRRTETGVLVPGWGFFGPDEEVTLSVLPLSQKGVAVDLEARRFPIANEFRSGLYDIDSSRVLVPLAVLQEMMALDRAERIIQHLARAEINLNEAGEEYLPIPEVVGIEPARATTILIKAREGFTPAQLVEACQRVYREFEAAYPPGRVPPSSRVPILTWDERPGIKTFVQAVKKETALVLVLFGIISLVAVVLIFSIFWSMVSEKTKDIGVLRAIGASRGGVAWLYIRFGLAIGVVGALAGGALAWLIVTNINPIHEWLGSALGIVVWDPQIYVFTHIPSVVEPGKAAMVLGAALVFSVIGATIPAIRAAWMDPVRALRFE